MGFFVRLLSKGILSSILDATKLFYPYGIKIFKSNKIMVEMNRHLI
ncbi:unnamed protein product [Chironomus riparius]|uniref:Uncharacterized protein n=1 Tax=Chironomus riparius TaxID=315576 RepID=A0A9N9S148_9DIPT|nr:unnamed protein product [Chironomus riparius]